MTTLTLFACTDTEVGKIKQVPTPTPHAPYIAKATPTPKYVMISERSDKQKLFFNSVVALQYMSLMRYSQ